MLRTPTAGPLFAFVILTALAAPVAAQAEWTRRQPAGIRPRPGAAMAFDVARGRAVMFGGFHTSTGPGETWEWDGSAWLQRSPGIGPTDRIAHALAYDSGRDRVLLFGGFNAAVPRRFADTWEWDGSVWIQRSPSVSPSPRHGHAMVHDVARVRVLLFGGYDSMRSTYLGDTWEWDGTDWARRTPATSPPARTGHAMAYDVLRGRTVLFGGSGPGVGADTWEWDGTVWTKFAAAGPPLRDGHTMEFDVSRGRVVLYGGQSGSLLDDTWEWDGTVWTRRIPAAAPSPRKDHAAAYDTARRRVVVFGGLGASTFGDTWEWDGRTWELRDSGPAPPLRSDHAMAESGGGALLFGGVSATAELGDTWLWDGSRWSFGPAGPPARRRHALAYDVERDRVVLFGGLGGLSSTSLGDTWEWDGTAWTRASTSGPAPRYDHAMAFDGTRGRVVLYGGVVGLSTFLDDTWEWDGTRWTEASPAKRPVGRWGHAMAHDAARGRVVLYGGRAKQALGDTWSWDGTEWALRSPPSSPGSRYEHGMAYDAVRDRVVLFGGYDRGGLADDATWEWDGVDWRRRALVTAPGAREGHAMAWSGTRVVLFGGSGGDRDAWLYGTPTPATWTSFGSGCAGTVGVPALAPSGRRLPWIGDVVTVTLSRLPPGRAAVVVTGASRTRWGAVSLPLALGFAGLTGCSLLVGPDVVVPVANPAGTASWSFTLCECPWLVGSEFFVQGVVADPGANPGGAVLSDGGAAVVGAR